MFLYLILVAFCYIHAFVQCLNTYKGFIFLFLNLLASVSILMQYILNAAFDVRYFMHIYLMSFFIINIEVANFVIFEILKIFSSTVFIGVNNISCFFYKWPNFPPPYTFSFFQKVMTEIKLTNKRVTYEKWWKYIYISF